MSDPMTQEEYKKNLGNLCPQCRSWEIEGEGVDIDGDEAHQEVTCMKCHATWTDTYKLASFNMHTH